MHFLIKDCTITTLAIVGGPNKYKDVIEKKIVDKNISNVELLGNLSRSKTIAEIQESDVGILINTENKHSLLHTSPIKYFEYLKANLKIVAVDFLHRSLPMSEKIILKIIIKKVL